MNKNDHGFTAFTRRDFLKVTSQLGLFLLGGAIYSTVIEPLWFDFENIVVKLPRLPEEFSGFRLAQIGDIHAGEQWIPGQLDNVIDKLIDIQPDILTITVDFVYSSPSMTNEILGVAETALRKLSSHFQYMPLWATTITGGMWSESVTRW